MNNLEKRKYIFGSVFLLANQLQVVGDELLDKMTTKQWFLTAILSQFQDHNPSLSELANAMGSSRQNVKQLALKLHKINFIEFSKNAKDGRSTTLKLTDEFQKYWDDRKDESHQLVLDLFSDFSDNEVAVMFNGFEKLLSKVKKMRQI